MTENHDVAIFVFEFLPNTQTFIYNEIAGISRYNTHVVSRIKLENTQFDNPAFQVTYFGRTSLLSRCLLYMARPRIYKGSFYRHIIGSGKKFCRYLNIHGIDMIHAHFAEGGYYVSLFIDKTGVPLVVSLHGGYDIKAISEIPDKFKEKYFQKVSCFIVPCKYLKDKLVEQGCAGKKIDVVPYGVNAGRNRSNASRRALDVLKILLVGRLTEKKGILDALTVVSDLRASGRKVRLTLITDGKKNIILFFKEKMASLGFRFLCTSGLGYGKKVRKHIRSSGLSEHVRILYDLSGEQVRDIMRESDILILPSRTASDGDTE